MEGIDFQYCAIAGICIVFFVAAVHCYLKDLANARAFHQALDEMQKEEEAR